MEEERPETGNGRIEKVIYFCCSRSGLRAKINYRNYFFLMNIIFPHSRPAKRRCFNFPFLCRQETGASNAYCVFVFIFNYPNYH